MAKRVSSILTKHRDIKNLMFDTTGVGYFELKSKKRTPAGGAVVASFTTAASFSWRLSCSAPRRVSSSNVPKATAERGEIKW